MPRWIDGVTFRDCSPTANGEVICKANKYQIIPVQPEGTPEEVLRRFAHNPVTVGTVKGHIIPNNRTIIKDIQVHELERGNGHGRALVEGVNSMGEKQGAFCQMAENLFDIDAGNTVLPRKFWTGLGYTVKKKGDYLNAYRGNCPELQAKPPRTPKK